MDGRAWWATVHRVAKSRTQLSNFTSPSQQASFNKSKYTETLAVGMHLRICQNVFSLFQHIKKTRSKCLLACFTWQGQ